MAGYHGYSMSNNAVMAYEDGEKPLSKWSKKAIIESIENNTDIKLQVSINELNKLNVSELREACLRNSSWHHTSNHYNETQFFEIEVEKVNEITADSISKIISNRKPVEKPQEYEAEAYITEWVGNYRRYRKPVTTKVKGIVKGNWFYLPDGSKKSINSNNFTFA